MILIKAGESHSVEIIEIVTDILLDIIPDIHGLFQLEQQAFRYGQLLFPAEPVGKISAVIRDVYQFIVRIAHLNILAHILIREAEGSFS